ncbi:Uncharacterized protein APZ42_030231 [Daphnia magna]|uniref:Uncharacterized protein n=1 Tax=Daphnia magna TaxID=35525 RepID=A0A164NYH7_9CRUS|nr:Uncharacterized protein APZ42_030231 [Daphnia magna]
MDSISDSARLDKLFRADTELTCCQWIDNGFKFRLSACCEKFYWLA